MTIIEKQNILRMNIAFPTKLALSPQFDENKYVAGSGDPLSST